MSATAQELQPSPELYAQMAGGVLRTVQVGSAALGPIIPAEQLTDLLAHPYIAHQKHERLSRTTLEGVLAEVAPSILEAQQALVEVTKLEDEHFTYELRTRVELNHLRGMHKDTDSRYYTLPGFRIAYQLAGPTAEILTESDSGFFPERYICDTGDAYMLTQSPGRPLPYRGLDGKLHYREHPPHLGRPLNRADDKLPRQLLITDIFTERMLDLGRVAKYL